MLKLSSQDRGRWLAVGLLLVLVTGFGLLLVLPIVNKSMELSDESDSLSFRLRQYQKVLAQKDAILDSMANLKEQQAEQSFFNSQGTDALVSAEMQEVIKKTIEEAGGQLSSTQTTPVSTKDGFSRITVRVRMTGDSEVLRTVLYKLETAIPFIVIDQVDIRPMRGQRNPVTRQLDPSNSLNINFQAVSFMRKPS